MEKSEFVKLVTDNAIVVSGQLDLDEKHGHNLIHAANKIAGKLYDAGYWHCVEISKDCENCAMFIRYRNKSGKAFDVMIFSNQSLIYRTRTGKSMKPARVNAATVIERLTKFISKE